MVEMTETANILRSATEDSLLVLDEIGRGTSTEDGLAIARAVSEYVLEHIGAKTLFATHFHQLTELEGSGIANFSMDVLERDGEIVFLKRVRAGPSDNSYGIHVAELAGIPEPVIRRAQSLLETIRAAEGAWIGRQAGADPPAGPPDSAQELQHSGEQLSLFSASEMVCQQILGTNVDGLTPLEALNWIARWRTELGKDG